MRRMLQLVLPVGLALFVLCGPAAAQNVVKVCVANTTNSGCTPVDSNNPFPVTGGGGGGGDVNLTGINGVAPQVGNGTTGTGTLRVTVSSDSTGTVTNPSIGSNGSAVKTSSTLAGVSDGTNQQQVVAPIALGDGVNGNNMVAQGGWVWNGTTWDRMAGTAAGGVKITNAGVAQGSTTSGQTVQPIGCRTLTSLPTDTTAQTNMPACTTSGELSTHDATLATLAAQGVGSTGAAVPAQAIYSGMNVGGNLTGLTGTANGLKVDPSGVTQPVSTASSTAYGLQSAASTNATSVKGSAGTLTAMNLLNTTTTVYYLRMYNLSTSPTCSSATGFVRSWPVPPAASAGLVGGIAVNLPAGGTAFSTGIAFCLTGGGSSTDNTNAATGLYINLDYQ